MKEILHQDTHYQIIIDRIKNIMIVKPIGFWRSPEVVPEYLGHVKNAFDFFAGKRFSVIIDASDMLTHPRTVQSEIHLKGMAFIQAYQPMLALAVMPVDDISTMQAQHLGRMSDGKIKSFPSLEEAEAYIEKFKVTQAE